MLPEIFSEQQIDFEKFKQLFANEIATNPDRYTLNWAGKSEAYQVLQTPTQQTLTPCEAESVDFAQSQNVFIEGENLEVLKILQKSYFNSVKMIYIDPPYNTGNDFIYKDNFAESQADYAEKVGDKDEAGKLKRAFVKNSKENGHYHSNWLNMMLPRLHLARNLLRDDGVIFISIDDNEQAQLKLLCDEVFGEENFVAGLVWSLGTGTQAGHFVRSHENILCYFKDKSQVNNFSGGEGIIEHSALKKISTKNPESEFLFPAGTRWDAEDGTELKGSWGGSEKMTLVKGQMIAKEGKLLYDVVLSAGYAQKSQMISWFSNQETFDTKGQKVLSFYFNKNGILRYEKERSVVNPPTILSNVGSTKNGTDEILSFFNRKIFDFPKPSSLIKNLLNLVTGKNDLILDFFAGSATTAHAVMQLNAEDGGNRRFICVQLPEKTSEQSEAFKAGFHTIAEISKERIRRAGKQIAEQYPDKTMDTGFKAFKLSGSHFKQWQSPTEQDLEKQLQMFIDPVAENTDTQAMMYELLLRLGFSLTAKVRWENHVYWVEENHQRVALILNEVNESIINAVMARQPQKVVMLDRLFNGDDAFKKNTELQMSDANITLWVI
ncbi:site-specific DNA-methyltransferase [Avibacterium paragallinarum]|uniref:site-specific DNA-methyltransferase n=1 Tax=Avibacterium paragallinarum TaxID=728 RepID=UPI00397C2181